MTRDRETRTNPPRAPGKAFLFGCVGLIATATVVALGLITSPTDGARRDGTPRSQSQVLIESGAAAFDRGELRTAGRLFAAATVLQPADARAQYDLGTVRQAQGDAPGARSSYGKALAIAPDFPAAIFNLATVDAATGHRDSAIGLYRRVLELQPANSAAMWNLGLLIRAGEGGRATARRLLSEAIRIAPSLKARMPPGVGLR